MRLAFFVFILWLIALSSHIAQATVVAAQHTIYPRIVMSQGAAPVGADGKPRSVQLGAVSPSSLVAVATPVPNPEAPSPEK